MVQLAFLGRKSVLATVVEIVPLAEAEALAETTAADVAVRDEASPD